MNSRNLLATMVCIAIVNAIALAVCGIGQAKITADYQKNGVQLSWVEPTQRIGGERLFSSEIAGYNIFRNLQGEADSRKINDKLITGTQYIDQSIEWGMCYSYAMTTVDKQGLEGPRSTPVQAIAPLAPPSNVQAFGLKRSVRLTWDRTNNHQIRGYTIYRALQHGEPDAITTSRALQHGEPDAITTETYSAAKKMPLQRASRFVQGTEESSSMVANGVQGTEESLEFSGQEYSSRATGRSSLQWSSMRKIASVLDTDHEYLDQEVVVGKNYYYRITAVDISWQESDPSPEVAATPLVITQEELSALERVNGFRATADKVSGNWVVNLQWEPVELENLAGYHVYRRLKNEGTEAAAAPRRMHKGTEGNTSLLCASVPLNLCASSLPVYQQLDKSLLSATAFRDEEVEPQKSYYYLIAAVDKDNNQAQFPREMYVTVADLFINSLNEDSGGLPLKGGKFLAVTMVAAAGKKAFVRFEERKDGETGRRGDGETSPGPPVPLSACLPVPLSPCPLKETDQSGVYYGQYMITDDINQSNLSLIGTVQDEQGEKAEYVSKDTITIDNLSPPVVRAVKAEFATGDGDGQQGESRSPGFPRQPGQAFLVALDEVAPGQGSICLSWDLPDESDDIAFARVFRSTADGGGSASTAIGVKAVGRGRRNCADYSPREPISADIDPRVSSFCDRSIQPGQGYSYYIAVYDRAGNETLTENPLSLVTPADSTPPKIYSLKELSSPGTKRQGDVIRIQLSAESQAEGNFSLGPRISQSFHEVGPGTYLGEYTVQAGDDLQDEPVLVELVDASANRSTLTADLKFSIDTSEHAGTLPKIAVVEHNAFQLAGHNPLVAGDVLRISIQGEPECTAYADLGAEELPVTGCELGVGSYELRVTSCELGVGKAFNPQPATRNPQADAESGSASTGHSSSVELNWDREGAVPRSLESNVVSYRVYCQQDLSSLITLLPGSPVSGALPKESPSPCPLSPGERGRGNGPCIAELPPGATHYRIENYRGGYISVAARKSAGDEQVILTPRMHIPLEEVKPGVYEGTYKIQPGDYIREGQIMGYLVNRHGEISLPVAALSPVTIDTTVSVAINPDLKCLRADGRSKTEIQIEVKDARERGAPNREIAIELFTTIDEYSGIVGVGSLNLSSGPLTKTNENSCGYFDNSYRLGGNRDWSLGCEARLVTDFGGKATASYVSGLAAKTMIMRARDMVTGCVGVGYITSYIEGLITLKLIDPPVRHRDGALQAGPSLQAWADREWLTADNGCSRTYVHAKVLDAEGNPLEGHTVSFSIDSGGGRIEVIHAKTDQSGQALARYFSGKHIDTIKIVVVDTSIGLGRDVFIVLKSDAPSKIEIEGTPLSLWADGASTSDLTIRVRDINDNPNRETPLEVEIVQGGGELILLDGVAKTDSLTGDCRLKYRAGTRPETVTIRARALSRIPGSTVLDKIRSAEKGMDF